MKDPKKIGYWTLTVLVALILIASGVSNVLRVDQLKASMEALGYPLYITTIIGTWKLLASLTIVAPKLPRLKEWAYAGITFNMTGAVASHIFAGDPVGTMIPPLMIWLMAMGSWALRPSTRKLAAQA